MSFSKQPNIFSSYARLLVNTNNDRKIQDFNQYGYSKKEWAKLMKDAEELAKKQRRRELFGPKF